MIFKMLALLRQTPMQLQRSLFLLDIQIMQQSIFMQRYNIHSFRSSKRILTCVFNPLLSNSRNLSSERWSLGNGDILSETKNERVPVVKHNRRILKNKGVWDNIEPEQHDEIMIEINTVSNMNNLLLCYIANAEIMNEKHLVEIFNKLDSFALKKELNLPILKKNKIYRTLCKQLKDNCSQLSMEDLIKVLTCMIRIRVPVRSHFFEVIIQNISQNIEKFTEKDLVFLNHLLSKVPPTVMVKKIQILCNLEYRLKYDFLSLSDLSTILFNCIECGGYRIGKILAEIYEHGNLNIDDPVKDLLRNLVYAGKEFFNLDKDDYQKMNFIMSECLEVLSNHIMQLKTDEVLFALSHMCQMNHVKFPCKYSLEFPNAIVRYSLNKDLPVEVNMQICIKLMELNYASVQLCDHTIEQIVKYPNESSNANVRIIPLLHSFACCSREHPQLVNALDILMQQKQIEGIRKYVTKEYFSLMYVLLILDYCQEELLMHVTNKEFLSQFLGKYPEPITHLQLMRIDHALSIQKSITERVPNFYLEQGCKFISELGVKDSTSSYLLRQILKPDFVASNVYTPEGLHIDHLLILNKNSCPQELVYERKSGSGVNITDVYAADYNKVIAIIEVHPMRVFNPDNLISGTVYMKQKVCQHAGYDVVLLLHPLLHKLPKENRPDFVKTELRRAGVFI